jgi:hypothetical protein
MGFGRRFARRAARKSVRRATPRSVRRAVHPARTARNAITPRPVKQVRRAAYTVKHPVGAAENAAIGAVLYPPRPHPPRPRRPEQPQRRGKRHQGGWVALGVIAGLICFVISAWLGLVVVILGVVIPVIVGRRARRRPVPPPAPFHWTRPPESPVPPWQPPVQPPQPQPPLQFPPAGRHAAPQRRVEPWPASQGFRTPPPDVTPLQQSPGPPQSAGDWELESRRRTGLGDGSHQ